VGADLTGPCQKEGRIVYEAVYNVRLTREQLAVLKERFGIALEVADRFGGGDYNIGLLWSEREEEFVQWCEENKVEAKLL
jgi:hypothetical protein